ncbi:hypothetical protein [Paraburkholderia sp. BL10I2N1]|uniref:hypothetical protein n=1 Tax=Paraburkholderia sp. BL10I2N1 TaxID=1938796 RepID=UPI001060426F|nr:hypothetical protein [Paraburkholderia sp. BL10I2N1]
MQQRQLALRIAIVDMHAHQLFTGIEGSATNGESFREVTLEPRVLRFRCARRGSKNVIASGFDFLTGPFGQWQEQAFDNALHSPGEPCR